MKLADVSIRRPVFATVMVAVLLVFGIVAYPRTGVDLFPNVEFPVATVTAIYPGADPETIETRVIDKLEEALNTISGIRVLRSTSLENVGQVLIMFELEREADQAVQDVRDKVAGVLRELPADLEPPVVAKFDIGAAPIMSIVLSGELPLREITRVADEVVKQRLQTVNGIGGVDIVGGREREFHVWIDPQRLEARGLAVHDVVTALKMQNVDVPGGRLNVGDRELVVKTRGQVRSAAELSRIIIVSMLGSPVRIADVARVEDGEEEARSHSALQGKTAVALVVRKQSGANTVAAAEAVRAAVDQLRARLPKGLSLAIPLDNSTYISHAIEDVQFDIAFGALLAVVIIMFFLHDWRATFISALAIPTSVIATFGFIEAMDFTFNQLTMLALSLSIGILVDDAIVVIEAIHRHVEMGKPPMQAASEACKEIGLAVTATTASIVAVFIPVAVMKGMIGRFFLQFGLTVAFAVTVSLFIAFTLTPTLSARMLRKSGGNGNGGGHGGPARKGGLSGLIERGLDVINHAYKRTIAAALRQRAVTVVVATLVFAGSLGLGALVPFEFLPPEDRGQFNVRLELPTGTSLGATRREVEAVAALVRAVPGVTTTFSTVGGGATGEVNQAEVLVNLVGRKQRAFDQDQAINHARALLARRFAARKDVQVAVEPFDPMRGQSGMRSAIIQFNIRGKDYGEINVAAAKIVAQMRKAGGYADIDTSYRGGKPEVTVTIDRDRAADLNVPIVVIAATLRTLVAGEKATELTVDGDRFDVRVRLEDAQRKDPESLLGLNVRATSGQLVPLSNLVTIARGSGPARIDRQARQRQVTILANLEGKPLGPAVAEMEALAKKAVPAHMVWDWAGMAEVMQESVGSMLVALILAIVLVYLILAAQFESFIHPFTIMLSLPLSLVGAVGALALAGMTMNIFSMIGIIMLMGLVTKNAILLVDYTNTLRRRGVERTEALIEAGGVRLRPILMTTGAMIAGMVPVALALSEGGVQRAPMAVTVIGGLITSTLLTLVVVPVAYSILDGIAERVRGKKGVAPGEAPEDGEPAAPRG